MNIRRRRLLAKRAGSYSTLDNARTLNFVQSEKWKIEVMTEDMNWHEGLGHFKSDRDREAFRAGFERGWSGLRKILSLHGVVRLVDPPARRSS